MWLQAITISDRLGCPRKIRRGFSLLPESFNDSDKSAGEGHPDVATSYNNIGVALHTQGKYDEALVYYQKALTILIKVLGEGHPDVATKL